MPQNIDLLNIYSLVSNCAKGCEGIRNEPENGIIGRSYYCPFEKHGVELLMVSKNPGIGSKEEKENYVSMTGKNRVLFHEKFVRARFEGRNDLITSKYHKNILDWVSVVLGVEATHDAVFKRSAMTAMVKCESLSDKTARLPRATTSECTTKYLFNEIETLKPKYLLALGGEAYKFLTQKNIQRRHNLSVGKLYHPSWTNMKGGVSKYIKEELPKLRKQFLDACKT